jgi:hypothetical protein
MVTIQWTDEMTLIEIWDQSNGLAELNTFFIRVSYYFLQAVHTQILHQIDDEISHI